MEDKYTIHAAPRGDLTEEQAQRVGAELLKIEAAHGELVPPAIVDAARPKGAELHGYFEWDDSLAAEQHRHEQARRLVRSVVIVPVACPTAAPVRAFVSVATGKGPVYMNTPKAMAKVETRSSVLEQANSELIAWRKRYQGLREFAALFEAIDRLEAA